MFRPAAQLTALCTCLALGACNRADVVARGVVESSNLADAASPSCDIASQLARAKLPTGLANVFVDCEWPLRQSDNPDEVGALLPGHDDEEDARSDVRACAGTPYRWWQEPPRPEPAQRLMYCPKACDVVKNWIRCKLREDVCNSHADRADDKDAGELDASARHAADGGAPHCAP